MAALLALSLLAAGCRHAEEPTPKTAKVIPNTPANDYEFAVVMVHEGRAFKHCGFLPDMQRANLENDKEAFRAVTRDIHKAHSTYADNLRAIDPPGGYEDVHSALVDAVTEEAQKRQPNGVAPPAVRSEVKRAIEAWNQKARHVELLTISKICHGGKEPLPPAGGPPVAPAPVDR